MNYDPRFDPQFQNNDFNTSLAQGIPNVGFTPATEIGVNPYYQPIGSTDRFGLAKPGTPGGSGFDYNNALSNFSLGAQGIAGLAGAYTGYKQLGLMKDQLKLQKGVANRNIANTAATTNRMLDDRASLAAQLTTGADYGTPEYLAAKEKLQTTVDGSPVG